MATVISRERNTLEKLLRGPATALRSVRTLVDHGRIRRELIKQFFSSREEFDQYKRELVSSDLLAHLNAMRQWFESTVKGRTARGDPYGFGEIDARTSLNLFATLRRHRPSVVVETGVCNGFSTAFVLLALHGSGVGHLYSIDLPEVAGVDYETDTFWQGKRGAVIPPGKRPGWVIPESLRSRWTLIEGRSQEALPPLLSQLGSIDVFLHDSEHSYECMRLEFENAYPALRDGGLLISDDYRWNTAFSDFAVERNREMVRIGPGTALIVK